MGRREEIQKGWMEGRKEGRKDGGGNHDHSGEDYGGREEL
jgi:hypothetical protein